MRLARAMEAHQLCGLLKEIGLRCANALDRFVYVRRFTERCEHGERLVQAAYPQYVARFLAQ